MADPDLIVIGGGTAGLVTSAGAAGIGARVVLVEQERLGGECLWTGCVPSKALIAAARSAHSARTAARFGIGVSEPAVDWAGVMGWVRGAQRRLEPHDSPERFRGLGVEVVQGTARFTGERTLDVNGRSLSAKRIVLATGSRPAAPPIEGLADVPYLTNETVFSLSRQPATLLVLGAGPIGIELAQAFARLGTRVQMLEASSRLLPGEDGELTDLLGRRLSAEGVEIILGLDVNRASSSGGAIRLEARREDGTTLAIEGEALLVATGRKANVKALESAAGGVSATENRIAVDDRLRTTARGVWAAGDVTGGPRFTHVADYQARLVLRNALFPFAGRTDYSVVPRVTFTDPELARVGLTEEEARERHGSRVSVWRTPFDALDRAVTDGEDYGMAKLVIGARGRILGGHVLGHGAGSLIAEIALAMRRGIRAAAVATTIHAYPTYSEVVRRAADAHYVSRFGGTARTIARWLARR